MKNSISSLFLVFFLMAVVNVSFSGTPDGETVEIKDTAFEKALIERGFDSGQPDGKVLKATIEGVKQLDLAWFEPKITDLSGIEHFSNLVELDIGAQDVRKLDLSQNKKLIELSIGGNENMQQLDVSQNIALKVLHLYDHDAGTCGISKIDLSKNTQLEVLRFDSEMITSIDLSHNTNLKHLAATHPWGGELTSGLTELDLSNNEKLVTLDCSWNLLSELDLSNNKKLKEIYCGHNQLTEIDVSANPRLKLLNCEANQLTELKLEGSTKLKSLYCASNPFKYLDLTKNNSLESVWCSQDMLNCIAAKPKTKVSYWDETGRGRTAENIPQTLSEDCK